MLIFHLGEDTGMRPFLIATIISICLCRNAMAQVIAACGEEAGYAYYPTSLLVSPKDSGFRRDAVTGGAVILSKLAENKIDLMFRDASKSNQSILDAGGEILITGLSDINISILVSYLGETSEIFDFYKKDNGEIEFVHAIVKPYNTLLPKAGIYSGKCENLNLDLLSFENQQK